MTVKGKILKNQKQIEEIRRQYGGDPLVVRYLLETDTQGMACNTFWSGKHFVVSPYNLDGSWTEDKIVFDNEMQGKNFIIACGFDNLDSQGGRPRLMPR